MRLVKTTAITILLLTIFTVFTACNGQNQKSTTVQLPAGLGDTVSELGKNIDCIYQDKNNNYWFASNGNGVYHYNGKTLLNVTDKHGLCSNFVWTIQEDVNGNLWFTGRDGVCCFNGKAFVDYTDTIKNAAAGVLHYQPGGLFFSQLNSVCFYDGKSFTNFTIHPVSYHSETTNLYRPYGVYCTLAHKDGNIWFGTQEKGVCKYDGKNFSFLSDKDLGGPAVRCLFQDKKGNLWFGNNGGGLFRYDGKTLNNITEERGLTNNEFLKEQKFADKPSTLARVWAINEDADGNLWVGTIDAGLWKLNGDSFTNYSTQNGLPGNSVWVIYKDNKGELWFVTNGETVCKYNGKTFVKFSFK